MSRQQHDILVIGAGISGLACAGRLSAAGYDVAVIERASVPGGRVRTEAVDGFLLDAGFQVLLTSYPSAMDLLDYQGLDLRRFPRGATVCREGKLLDVVDPRDNPAGAVRAMRQMLSLRDMGGLWFLLDGDDLSSISQVLMDTGMGEALREGFIRPFLRGIFLDPQLLASAERMRFYLRMMVRGHAAIPAAGMAEIPRQLAAAAGSRILYGREVVGVGPEQVMLADGETVSGKALVMAADGSGAGRIAGVTATGDFLGTACYYFDADAALLTNVLPLVLNGDGETDGPINHVAIPTLVSEKYAPPGRALISANEIGVRAGGATPAQVLDQLQGWFGPQVKSWRHLRTVTVPRALPAMHQHDRWLAFADSVRGRLEGQFLAPVAVAGDYSEDASLHGAMTAGLRAADEIIQALPALS